MGSAHEFMGIYKLNKYKAAEVAEWDPMRSGALDGLPAISMLLREPLELLEEHDKAVMQSLVASLGKIACDRSRSGSPDTDTSLNMPASSVSGAAEQHAVLDCLEMHTGIASTQGSDCLSLSYRIKLPHVLGGYESTWKPLYNYNFDTNSVSRVPCAPAMRRVCLWKRTAELCNSK